MSEIWLRIAVFGFVLLLAAILLLAIQIDDWQRDLTTNRAATTNDAQDPLLRPLAVATTLEELKKAAVQFADGKRQWRIATIDQSDNSLHISLERTSRLFSFVDDVRLHAEQENDSVRISVESASRVGKGDLGQNPRNIHELLGALRKDLPLINGDDDPSEL